MFTLLVDEPVAAASIGQVYKARLRNGKVVALKVQRPDCERVVALDLFVLRWWARLGTSFFVRAFGRDLDLVSVVDDFGALIYREIDYRAEARNARQFAKLYQGYENTIRVPEIYDELTTSTVLTMEWVDGTRLVDGAELAVYTGDDKAGTRLVDALVQCSLRQMLDSGFFHADPHAGNLLATDDGRLCYLDFGMMSYLEERQRVSIIEAVVHLVNRDFEALADLYVRMGFIKAGTDVKPIVRGLQDALPDVLDAPVSELNVKNVASRLGAISASLHAIDATRVHLTMTWVVSLLILRPFGHRDAPRRRRHVHVPLCFTSLLRRDHPVPGRVGGRGHSSGSRVPHRA